MTSIGNIYSVNMIGHLYNLLPSAKHKVFHMPADHALSPFPPSPSLLTGIVPQRPLRYAPLFSAHVHSKSFLRHSQTHHVSLHSPSAYGRSYPRTEKIRSLGHTLKILCGPSPLSDGDGGNGNKTGVIDMHIKNKYLESSGSNGQVSSTASPSCGFVGGNRPIVTNQ